MSHSQKKFSDNKASLASNTSSSTNQFLGWYRQVVEQDRPSAQMYFENNHRDGRSAVLEALKAKKAKEANSARPVPSSISPFLPNSLDLPKASLNSSLPKPHTQTGYGKILTKSYEDLLTLSYFPDDANLNVDKLFVATLPILLSDINDILHKLELQVPVASKKQLGILSRDHFLNKTILENAYKNLSGISSTIEINNEDEVLVKTREQIPSVISNIRSMLDELNRFTQIEMPSQGSKITLSESNDYPKNNDHHYHYGDPHRPLDSQLAALSASITRLTFMHQLKLDTYTGTQLAKAFAAIPTTITSLRIWDDCANLKGKALAHAFKAIPSSVTTLEFICGLLSPRQRRTVKQIARAIAALHAKVNTLDLWENNLGEYTGAELATIFAAIPISVRTLKLGSNHFKGSNALGLAQAFAALRAPITTLIMWYNDLNLFTVADLVTLFSAVPRSVITIDLTRNDLQTKNENELRIIIDSLPDNVTTIICDDPRVAMILHQVRRATFPSVCHTLHPSNIAALTMEYVSGPNTIWTEKKYQSTLGHDSVPALGKMQLR